MESQIRRLAFLVACTALVACLSFSAWGFYRAHVIQKEIREVHIAMSKWYSACERESQDKYCNWAKVLNTTFDELVLVRDSHRANATMFLWLGFGMPVATLFIFFARRWVRTGTFRQHDVGEPKDSRRQATDKSPPSDWALRDRLLWVICSLFAVGALFAFGSDRTYETLVASLVQVFVVISFVWIIGRIQKLFARIRGSKNES